MSYINEALQKAQKEKESNYAAYGRIISAGPEKEPPPRKLLLAGFAVLAGLAAVAVFLFYGKTAPKEPAAKPAAVKQAGVKPQAVSSLPAANSLTRPENSIPAEPVVEKHPVKEADTGASVDADALFARALAKQNEGNLMEAKELYRKLIKIDPRNVQALNNLGVIYLARNNYKWASIRLRDALAIKPDYVDAHYNLACLYSRKGDLTRSFRHWKKAADLNPEVRRWTKNDTDLRELSKLPAFHNLLKGQEN